VFIPDTSSLEFSLPFSIIDLLEDIPESAIIFLQDGILGGKVQGPFLIVSINEGALSEIPIFANKKNIKYLKNKKIKSNQINVT
jgi:hypothetical protein